MFGEKKICFRGSKERLRKMVLNRNGEFLEEQRFMLVWRSSQYKKMHTLTFRIRCRYEKNENGYCLSYRIFPTAFSVMRMILPWTIWGWALLNVYGIENLKEGSVLIAFGVVYTATQLWQWVDSKKEFIAKFTTETR